MSAMEHKLGTQLATGATASPVTKTHTQTARRSAGGELRIIHGETGADLSVYVTDPHSEQSFEAVMEADAPDKEIGDTVSVDDDSFVVTQWEVTESNDDVKRVSIGLRSVDITSSGSNSNANTTTTTTTNP